jgi:hypothetical protein
MKNKRRQLLLSLVLITIVNVTCKRRIFQTRVEGQVLNQKTGIAVADQRVYLYLIDEDYCIFGCNTKTEVIATTLSDSKGHYTFVFKAEDQFKLEKKGRYQVQGTDAIDNDIRFYKAQPVGELRLRRTTKVDILLAPKASIKVQFKSLKPIDSGTPLDFQLLNNDAYAYIPPLYGPNIDKTIELKVREGVEGINVLRYSFVRNGITNTKDTALFVASYETVNLKLSF